MDEKPIELPISFGTAAPINWKEKSAVSVAELLKIIPPNETSVRDYVAALVDLEMTEINKELIQQAARDYLYLKNAQEEDAVKFVATRLTNNYDKYGPRRAYVAMLAVFELMDAYANKTNEVKE